MTKCSNCIFEKLDFNIKQIKKGEYLFMEGDTVDSIYKIKSGLLKVSKLYETGDERTLDILTTNDFVALLTILKRSDSYLVSAYCLEDTEVVVIPKEDALTLFEKNKEFQMECFQCATSRLTVFQKQTFDYSSTDTVQNVSNLLLYLYQKFGYLKDGNKMLKLPVNKTELANMIGMRRETFSRKLSLLEQSKKIKQEKNIIQLLDM